MQQINTPQIIDASVINFCKSIAPGATPEYIQVCPGFWCRQNECYNNVKRRVKRHGGKRQLGWRIQMPPDPLPKYMIEAVHHAIWITEEGEKIDITPQPNSGGKIVFLPDDSIELGEFRIGEKYQALFDWQEVIEYVRLCNLESIEYVNKTKLNKSPKIPKNITKQQGNLLQQIMIKAMQKNLIDVSLLKKK